jgi:hypothetical protein
MINIAKGASKSAVDQCPFPILGVGVFAHFRTYLAVRPDPPRAELRALIDACHANLS